MTPQLVGVGMQTNKKILVDFVYIKQSIIEQRLRKINWNEEILLLRYIRLSST